MLLQITVLRKNHLIGKWANTANLFWAVHPALIRNLLITWYRNPVQTDLCMRECIGSPGLPAWLNPGASSISLFLSQSCFPAHGFIPRQPLLKSCPHSASLDSPWRRGQQRPARPLTAPTSAICLPESTSAAKDRLARQAWVSSFPQTEWGENPQRETKILSPEKWGETGDCCVGKREWAHRNPV